MQDHPVDTGKSGHPAPGTMVLNNNVCNVHSMFIHITPILLYFAVLKNDVGYKQELLLIYSTKISEVEQTVVDKQLN